MNKPLLYTLGAFLAVSFTACDDYQARAKADKLEADLEALRAAIAADNTRPQIQKLEADIEGIRKGMLYLFQLPNAEKRAVLDPTAKGYTFVDCAAGRLVVSCAGAEQYLDGHKIILSIGNPFTSTFTGFKLKTRYGQRPPVFPAASTAPDQAPPDMAAWQASHNAWEKSLKSQDISFTEALLPGAWTKVELILSPSKPEEVGFIDIQMQTDTLSLRKPTP
jgi:Protein of unknown function (DUF3251)